MVYLSLIPWETCNWDCLYCHEDRRIKEENELTLEEMISLVDEASDLGMKSVLFLGGEVLLRNTWDTTLKVVERIHHHGLVPLIYTNGSQLNEEMAGFLADHNASIALKIDSLVKEKYDHINQRTGSFQDVMRSIEILKNTSIGEVVLENHNEKLVRLLFTTVGNSLNTDEYVSIARFATNHNARWMMEELNYRGDAVNNPQLALDLAKHNEAMKLAILLNPEQMHDFHLPCRLFSCVTIRKKGEIGICPQDYSFLGNIRSGVTLKEACGKIQSHLNDSSMRSSWKGKCPIKQEHFVYS